MNFSASKEPPSVTNAAIPSTFSKYSDTIFTVLLASIFDSRFMACTSGKIRAC